MLRRLLLASALTSLALPACSNTSDDTAAGEESGDASETGSGSETAGDGGSETGGDDGPALPTEAGPDTQVVAFDQTHLYFAGWEEGQNFRQVDVEVEFPEASLGYESITATLTLGCPNNLCDWWDRKGFIALVQDAGTEDESLVEIVRMMTPYRVGGTWTIDVTRLRPLLAGTVTLRAYIDTWVGPGHANGDGWLVTTSFDMVGGLPDSVPMEVLSVYPEQRIDSGDPNNPIIDQAPDRVASIPAWADRVELRSIITGHGQGNLNNCAEFCVLGHGYMFDDVGFAQTLWRDDCAQNPVNNQAGNWTPSRAGWCPGDIVPPWVEDVTTATTPGADVNLHYEIEGYENTCRPDAPVCTGCALGTGCDYDNGSHTPPEYRMSAALVVYKDR